MNRATKRFRWRGGFGINSVIGLTTVVPRGVSTPGSQLVNNDQMQNLIDPNLSTSSKWILIDCKEQDESYAALARPLVNETISRPRSWKEADEVRLMMVFNWKRLK